MKRKLMCLLLAALMAFSCFAAVGCSNTKDDETVEGGTTDEAALTTVTLTLWIPTDKNTSEEAILAVQEEMNRILKAKFETAIELHAIPSDEYEEAVDARLTEIEEKIAFEEAEAERKRKEAKELAAMGITTAAEETTAADSDTTPADEETFVNDIGMAVVRYPEVEETQMDIFLVRGFDNYKAYIEREALSALEGEVNGSSKLLKQYIHPTFLNYAKLDGSLYALPNNHVMGEYKYLLVNKRLVEEFYWNPDSLNTLIRCKDFILDVKERTDVTPFVGEIEPAGMFYWSTDGSPSILGAQLTNDTNDKTYAPPKNVYTIKNYVDTVSLKKVLEENDCIETDISKVDEFGVALIKGDASLPAQYEEDYYVTVYEKPTATTEDIFASMFGVSVYTKSLTRSMEILTYLNTDTELRTILQYGVEGTHWQYGDTEKTVIDIISNDYKMNLLETGNVYMTYPGEGIPMSEWETAKKQNLDTKLSPYIGFVRSDYLNEHTEQYFKDLEAVSKEYFDKVDAMTAEEFDGIVNDMKKEVNGIELIATIINSEGDNTPGSFYLEYFNAKK